MGAMLFAIPDRSLLPPEALARVYMAGMEGIPWFTQTTAVNGGFRLERTVSESGEVYVPWVVEGWGEIVLSTATLMERPQPYLLALELARGTLNRFRNQFATWKAAGFEAPSGLESRCRDALKEMAAAATAQENPAEATRLAQEVILKGLTLNRELAEEFSRQALAARQRRSRKLPTLLVGNLENRPLSEEDARLMTSAFNTMIVPLNWHDLEPNEDEHTWGKTDRQYAWCAAAGVRVMAGPLLELNQKMLPDWLFLWEDDPSALQTFLAQHIARVVERYGGKTHLWHAMSRVNMGDLASLNEEDQLRMAVAALEALRQVDGRTPVIVSFDQPWGEYVGLEDIDLSPLHFADALARADLGLSGLGLEMNLGYWPGGTQPRDLLEIGRHLDRWSSLGLPLVLFLTAPSSGEPDPHSQASGLPTRGRLSPQEQAEDVRRLMRFLLSKQAVQGIVWNQTHDRYPHRFAHGGLFDLEGNPKPVLGGLRELREELLM